MIKNLVYKTTIEYCIIIATNHYRFFPQLICSYSWKEPSKLNIYVEYIIHFCLKDFPIGLRKPLREDNLSTRDKWSVPNLSFVQRFYCIANTHIIYTYMQELIKMEMDYGMASQKVQKQDREDKYTKPHLPLHTLYWKTVAQKRYRDGALCIHLREPMAQRASVKEAMECLHKEGIFLCRQTVWRFNHIIIYTDCHIP